MKEEDLTKDLNYSMFTLIVLSIDRIFYLFVEFW